MILFGVTKLLIWNNARVRTDTELLFSCSLNLIAASEWDIGLNTGREIPFLRATMHYFVHYINTICLYWGEKSTLFMNVKIGCTIREKKSIGSVMLGNVKATIFSKYHCLIYSTFLSGPALAYNGKEKAVQSGWRIPVLAISTGCLYRLLLIGVSWYKSTWENKI